MDSSTGPIDEPEVVRPKQPHPSPAGHVPRAGSGDEPLGRCRPRSVSALLVISPVLWGVVAGWWTPRGPLTTSHSLSAIVIGLVVGGLTGWALGSWWAMIVAPITFVVVFEAVRVGIDGPTVDAPALSTYGMVALVVGRGFHGLVALVPMSVGAAFGAGAARTDTTTLDDLRRRTTVGKFALNTLFALIVILIAALVARPARTERIVSATGEELPGSIAEITTVKAGNHELGLMIRGASTDNPVVLFLAGGPGGSERGAMRKHLESLEGTFMVATWDQRGSGTSYAALDPTETLTLASQIDETIEVTDYLRRRFGQERIYLLGQSWGSTLGVLAVQAAPDRYAAFIGTGQMVSQLETDRIFYHDTLTWAERSGNTALVEKLRRIGPPPYSEMLDYETALSFEHEVYPYDHSRNSEGVGGFSENILVSEYSLPDQVHLLGAFMDTFAALYPQLTEIDFRDSATRFEVPMFFVQGAHEAEGRARLFDEWYPMIEAPTKDLVVLDTSGHRPLFEQPDEFVEYMNDTVLAATTDS